MARLILVLTAAALVLLGRPLDRQVATWGGDERASCSTGDDLVLSSGRRNTPAIRGGEATTEAGSWSVDLGHGYENVVLTVLMSEIVFATAVRHAPRSDHPPAVSTRGPPAVRA